MGIGKSLTISGLVLALLATAGCGKKLHPEYTFQFKGANAAVMHDQRDNWLDRYFIQVCGQNVIREGHLVSDDGKLVRVYGFNERAYSVKDYSTHK